jgi:nucleoside-diphosphate-sugar epimerase
VTVVGRNRYPAVEAKGAHGIEMDLSTEEDLSPLCEGVDAVFHTAAKAGIWGSRQSFFEINVTATQRLVGAARVAGVSRFVHTSSPSVVFSRGHHALGATEDQCPYPQSYTAHYPETKALAEQFVLSQNAPGFAVTALRPHLIWGPGDPHLLPRLVDRHRRGRLVQVGSGTKVSFTFVENAARAHVQACDALTDAARPPAGRAYFVTDDEPVDFWVFANTLLTGLGLGRVRRRVPYMVARAAASAAAGVWEVLGLDGEPPMTPFVVDQLAHSHWYSSAAAKRDFGYAPTVGHEEALRRTLEAFQR